ncbi:MAG: homoserine dehydrogenase [Peptoniphilus sp.]|nr:homoserine dehydrogenase [Peptoniphilus sp.]MDD7363445.1 homoserine dehydrogenase [Bacillota bacterium]MDY6044851.1 homoserine dehydrogenase [Peptoniphilus sp.]
MKVALIGLGTVGRGAYDILKARNDVLKETVGAIDIAYIVVTERSKERLSRELEETVVTSSDYDRVLDEVDLVVEATGAIDIAYDYMKRALEKGIGVVTANKAAVSAYYKELTELAEKHRVPFLFEAAVGGGIPVLTPLRALCLQNDIGSIRGILNGTCNYLINAMFKDGADYDETLALCQELGYAEQDPTDDVEGYDTRRKLHILIEMAYGHIDGEAIPTKGIAQLTGPVVSYLKEHRKKVKLVASAKPVEGGIEAVVEPVVLDESDELALLPDAINEVDIEGSWVGDVAFRGPGAGKEPTGNAVVSDIVSVLSNGALPLLSRGDVALKPVFGRYLVAEALEGDFVETVDGDFTLTREMERDELLKHVDAETFFARIDA